MAYSDSIRAATADLNDVASLIDGTLLTTGSYSGVTLGLTTTSASYGALGVAAITLTVPASSKVFVCASVSLSHGTTGKYILAGLSEDSTTVISGQAAAWTEKVGTTSGYSISIPVFHVFSSAAGSHTWRVLWLTDAATAYCNSVHMHAICFRA